MADALEAHARRLAATPVRALFAADAGRFAHCSREACGLLMDFSRQRLDGDAFDALLAWARTGTRPAAGEQK